MRQFVVPYIGTWIETMIARVAKALALSYLI